MIKLFETIKYRRIAAYFIDMFVVIIVISLLGQIKFLNPNYDKYTKLSKEFEKFSESLIEDQNITSEELINSKEYINYVYKLSHYSISNTITQFIVIVLYFTLFPIFNNNQTIGKRLFRIQVVDIKKKKVSWYKHLLRALILPIYNSLVLFIPVTLVFNLINVLIFKEKTFLYTSAIISFVFCIYSYFDVIYMISNKDDLTLHDKIIGTKVVEK